MKKIRVLITAILILLGLSTATLAADSVKIKVNGIALSDAQAILKDGSTLLPVRSVSNALGGTVTWDNATKTVIIEKDGTMVIAPVGEKFMLIDDKTKAITIPPQIIDGKTYIPLRVIGEALSCEISWVNATKTVEINSARKDLFGDDKKEENQEPLVEDIYMARGEIILIPVPKNSDPFLWRTGGTQYLHQVDAVYNGQDVLMVAGNEQGTSETVLELFGYGYKEYIFHIVADKTTEEYVQAKKARVASGWDYYEMQKDFIHRENITKEKYDIELLGFNEKEYVAEDKVLIIPIKSNQSLTGELSLTVSSHNNTENLDVVMDRYMGHPALFIKGVTWGKLDAVLRYTKTNNDTLNFTYDNIWLMDLYTERESISSDPELSKLETAAWEFEINVTKNNSALYKEQEKERLAQGISYDLYLSGLV